MRHDTTKDEDEMVRRMSVLALAAVMVLSTLAAPAAGQDEVGAIACPGPVASAGFTDVPAGNAHAAAIDCAAALGIVTGVSADRFAPAGSVSRGQVASLLARSLGELGITLPPLAGAPSFPDAGATHGDSIRQLAAAGIVAGFDDGTYRPGAPVTRQQFASLVVRLLEYVRTAAVTADGPAGFPDVAASNVHAIAIAAAVAEGLFTGRGDGTFEPTAATRRDQAASVIVRLLDVADADVQGEVWSLDQGTDTIHVYDARTDVELARIDVSPATLQAAGFAQAPTAPFTVPHMIEFDSRERYAFIASTVGQVTIVIDTRTKQVVEVLNTGAGTHMAAVTPDDSAVWIAAIAAERLVEIPLDLDADDPTFAIGRSLDVGELLAPFEAAEGWEFPSYQPVCHQYSPDSTEAWVTLGPGWNQGGFFVLDLASGTATHAWDPEVVKANCGVSVTEDIALANWSGRVVADDDTNGEWYVFDADTKQLLQTRDAEGFDAHGLRLSPDGSVYWQVNRNSDNALVIDATTLEVIARYDDVADTPDILDYSPDGSLVYISQRGPSPRSGAVHSASGSRPAVAVIDAATGQTLRLLEPPVVQEAPSVDHPQGRILNDIHGVGVRARGTGEVLLTSVQLASVTAPIVVPAVELPPGFAFTCSLPG